MQTEPQQEQPESPSPTVVEIVDNRDNFLQMLVHMVNTSSISFDITLVVGGFLISGLLIPGDEYYETLGLDFGLAATRGNAEAAKDIQEGFASLGERYKKDREDKSGSSQTIGYIHLKNCKLGSVSSQATFGSIWRGRLSEVSGFFLGTFTASK